MMSSMRSSVVPGGPDTYRTDLRCDDLFLGREDLFGLDDDVGLWCHVDGSYSTILLSPLTGSRSNWGHVTVDGGELLDLGS